MTLPHSKILGSALYGGAAAAVFAPLLWPLVVRVEQGHAAEWSVLPSALISVASYGLFGGLIIGLFIGFPVLLLFQRLHISHPFLVVIAGALVGSIILSGFMSWPVHSWPLYAFAATVGGLCGAVAAWHMRSNSAPQADAREAAHLGQPSRSRAAERGR